MLPTFASIAAFLTDNSCCAGYQTFEGQFCSWAQINSKFAG